jgi:hypothetical protein
LSGKPNTEIARETLPIVGGDRVREGLTL